MRRRLSGVFALLSIVGFTALGGCGAERPAAYPPGMGTSDSASVAPDSLISQEESGAGDSGSAYFVAIESGEAVERGEAVVEAPPADGAEPRDADATPARAAKAPTARRHIIQRATLVLDVEKLDDAERRLGELLQSAGGYIAQFREHRTDGRVRSGQWTLRVPVAAFDAFLAQVESLGVAQRRERDADDVTEKYVDLAARLKNKQQLEARLLELVARRSDEIKDVIAVEGELARVREEIERMQGQLRYLADRAALTTIELTLVEQFEYHPPEATFTGQIAQTFWLSVGRLREVAEAIVLLAVALAPWGVALVVLAAPWIWLARRLFRGRQEQPLDAPIV
ncbi:MAG: DUF4349 domain-containing protein [Pirellulaceae bacterium]|nr:DUF4349 domain-containing protein [Pirellulaceae bacterium]